MNKEDKQKLIDHMFKATCGYGMAEGNGYQSKFDKDGSYMPEENYGTVEGGKVAFEKCMNSIPDEYFEDFIYTLYRIADKSGSEGFELFE